MLLTELRLKDERNMLEQLLRLLEKSSEVPAGFPHTRRGMIRILVRAWGRDGRAGHLRDEDVASLISARVGCGYDRQRYQLMFGNGKLTNGELYVQLPSMEVWCAYLAIAMENWSLQDTGQPAPLTYDPPIDLEKAIKNAGIMWKSLETQENDLRPLLEEVFKAMEGPISLADIAFLARTRRTLYEPMPLELIEPLILGERKRNASIDASRQES